jgi:cation:H+ antiporter
MAMTLIQFCLSALVVVIAGIQLARSTDAIAEVTGLGRLLVGSVLLGGATSLPELTVDISAVRMKMPDLAVGDLMGSSLMNLLILALLDMTTYSRGKMLSRSAAMHALSGQFSIVLTGIVVLGLLTTKSIPEYSLFGIHLWLWGIVAVYILGIRMVYLDQRWLRSVASESETNELKNGQPMSLKRATILFVICAAAIVIAGPYLASAAGEIADQTGLGKSFVGTTLLALCTSLPELVSSVAALRMGAIDLAIGNVFGSNAFNMLLFVPLDALHPHALFATVGPGHVLSGVSAIVATAVVLIGQLYHVELRTRWLEPDAVAVVLIVVGSLALVYFSG